MMTEQYIINFYSMHGELFNKDIVIALWKEAADCEYKRSKMYMNAVIENTDIICSEYEGCKGMMMGVRVTSIRNSVYCSNAVEYYDSMRRVILDVKQALRNPYTSISVIETNYFYFEDI